MKTGSKTYFKEEQHFSSPWFWVFLIAVFTISLASILVPVYSQLILGNPDGENPESFQSLMVIFTIMVVAYIVVIIMFKKMKLVTTIRPEGVFYKYPPFIVKERVFNRDEIHNFKIRKYRALREYSGWGIKYSWGKFGRAVTVSGDTGLQLYLKDGKKVLFGTQRGVALKRAMEKMMKSE